MSTTPMPINSRTKGKVGEREWAEVLRSHGFRARRGQQFAGGNTSADVVANLPLHWEVKRVENLNILKAMAQATHDSAGKKPPCVAHRRNHGEWLITMKADDLLPILAAHYKDGLVPLPEDAHNHNNDAAIE